jgi:hypothetical protein
MSYEGPCSIIVGLESVGCFIKDVGSAMVLSLSECAVGGFCCHVWCRGDMHEVMYRMYFSCVRGHKLIWTKDMFFSLMN